jgi:hypothetical protein
MSSGSRCGENPKVMQMSTLVGTIMITLQTLSAVTFGVITFMSRMTNQNHFSKKVIHAELFRGSPEDDG